MKLKTAFEFNIRPIEKLFGLMPIGKPFFLYELVNKNGMKLKIINLGATMIELKIPLKNGTIVDVVLEFEKLDSYLKSIKLESAPYFGACVGRFAGRINNGTFVLNDTTTILDKNNNDHSLHDQEVIVNSRRVVETNNKNIPTGGLLETKNTEYDISTPKKTPSEINTTFVLDRKVELEATLLNKNNNLKMTVFTNKPRVHSYVAGNCFNMIKGKEKASHHPFSGIYFETQNFLDTPNHENFLSVVLKKGDEYAHKTIYKF